MCWNGNAFTHNIYFIITQRVRERMKRERKWKWWHYFTNLHHRHTHAHSTSHRTHRASIWFDLKFNISRILYWKWLLQWCREVSSKSQKEETAKECRKIISREFFCWLNCFRFVKLNFIFFHFCYASCQATWKMLLRRTLSKCVYGILKHIIKIRIESNTTTKRIINPFWAGWLAQPPYVNNKLVSCWWWWWCFFLSLCFSTDSFSRSSSVH